MTDTPASSYPITAEQFETMAGHIDAMWNLMEVSFAALVRLRRDLYGLVDMPVPEDFPSTPPTADPTHDGTI